MPRIYYRTGRRSGVSTGLFGWFFLALFMLLVLSYAAAVIVVVAGVVLVVTGVKWLVWGRRQ